MMSAMSALVAAQKGPPTRTPRADVVLCGVEGKLGPGRCGKYHPGGPAKCFFLHPNLVPGHMNYILKGIHARRAACTPPLEDLSAQYPYLARGAAAVLRADPEEEICETCPVEEYTNASHEADAYDTRFATPSVTPSYKTQEADTYAPSSTPSCTTQEADTYVTYASYETNTYASHERTSDDVLGTT